MRPIKFLEFTQPPASVTGRQPVLAHMTPDELAAARGEPRPSHAAQAERSARYPRGAARIYSPAELEAMREDFTGTWPQSWRDGS